MSFNSDQLALIKQEVKRWESIVTEKKAYYRGMALFTTLTVSILSASASVLLGIHLSSWGDYPRIISLILTAIISIASTFNAFFNFKELWIANDSAKFRLGRLNYRITLLEKKDVITEEMLNIQKDVLEDILIELNGEWKKNRR